jgi:hypothetical protein
MLVLEMMQVPFDGGAVRDAFKVVLSVMLDNSSVSDTL